MSKSSSILLVFLLSGNLFAGSLKVSPAGFIIHNVIPGKTYNLYEETNIKLSICNAADVSHSYALSSRRPSECGKWEKGYLEIPDARWCWFEKKEITIGPQEVGYGTLFIKIPAEEKYYNQHWVTTLTIMGKSEKGIGMGLGIYVRAQIETQSRADLKGVTPDGLIGVVPSVITLKAQETGEVVIFNNSATNETYKIYPLTDKEKFQKYISAGFIPLPEPDWLKLGDGSLTIPVGGRKTLSLKVSLPEKEANSDKKYESIVFVEGQGATGFVRVRIMGADDKTEVRK